jgi:hypothetical protein
MLFCRLILGTSRIDTGMQNLAASQDQKSQRANNSDACPIQSHVGVLFGDRIHSVNALLKKCSPEKIAIPRLPAPQCPADFSFSSLGAMTARTYGFPGLRS